MTNATPSAGTEPTDIELTVLPESLQELDIATLQKESFTWFTHHVWTVDVLIQLVLIAGAFLIAAVVNKLASPRLVNSINKLPVPPKAKQILHNLRRLILPFTGLVILFLITLAGALGSFLGETELLEAAMGLALAWVMIRAFVQIIANPFMRNLCATIIWIIAALGILGILDETAAAFDTIGMNIGDFRLSFLTVLKSIFALVVLLYFAAFLSSLIERQIKTVTGLTASSRVLISKIVRVTLMTFALLIGITSAGIDLSLFAVFSGAVGLGIGFGMQKGISNLFSGMLLLMDESIKPGDIIELPNGAFGWVEKMGARYTAIVTRDNKSFLIPNEDFVTQQIVNWSHGNTLIRVEVKFGVHHNSDPHIVKKLAEDAARLPGRVVRDPAPVCHLVEFGESSLNFVLRFWIKDAEKGVTNMKGDVMLALWDSFKENQIRIPYPHREVFMHQAPEDDKRHKPAKGKEPKTT